MTKHINWLQLVLYALRISNQTVCFSLCFSRRLETSSSNQFYCPFVRAYCCTMSRHRQHCSLAKWQKCLVPFPCQTTRCDNNMSKLTTESPTESSLMYDVWWLARSLIRTFIQSSQLNDVSEFPQWKVEIEENGRIGKSTELTTERMGGRTGDWMNNQTTLKSWF